MGVHEHPLDLNRNAKYINPTVSVKNKHSLLNETRFELHFTAGNKAIEHNVLITRRNKTNGALVEGEFCN